MDKRIDDGVQILSTMDECIAAFKTLDERKTLHDHTITAEPIETNAMIIEKYLCDIAKSMAMRCSMIAATTRPKGRMVAQILNENGDVIGEHDCGRG